MDEEQIDRLAEDLIESEMAIDWEYSLSKYLISKGWIRIEDASSYCQVKHMISGYGPTGLPINQTEVVLKPEGE